MAIIWKKQTRNNHYEVRTAGNSKRLYTNGIFHSQYNSRRLFTGSIWDLLSLPGLFLYGKPDLRILVLGVGGGTSLHQLHYMLNPRCIIGVEWDKVHISIAKNFFDLDKTNIELICQDAISWVAEQNNKYLSKNAKQQFDIIIDDLFIEQDGEPERAIKANRQWFVQLLRLLSARGIIVQNHVSPSDFRNCAYFKNVSLNARFKSAFRLHNDQLDNIVGVFCRQHHDKSQLTNVLAQLKKLPVAINRNQLNYVLRKISIGPK